MKRITGSWKVISNLKECPICRSRYDSCVVLCPLDGSILNEITITKYTRTDSGQELLLQMRESVLCNNLERFAELLFKTANYFRISEDYISALKWFHILELLWDGDPANTHLPSIIDLHIRLAQPQLALLHIRRLAGILSVNRRLDLANEYFKQFITHQPTDTAWVREVMSIIDEFGFSISPTDALEEIPLEELILKDTVSTSALSTAEQKSLRLSGSFKITNEMGRISFEDIHVLIVSDEKAVSDLFSELLGDFGCSVTVVGSTELSVSALMPSIIIFDTHVAGCEAFYSRVRSEMPSVRFIALADARFELKGVDIWYKPFDVEELVIKFRGLLQRVKLTAGLKGNLQSMSLSELLRIIASEGLTGELRVSHGIKSGIIFIDKGNIIDSLTEDLSGERAFYMLFISCLDSGYFEFNSQVIERAQVIKASLEGLFSEAFRRAELEKTLIEMLPPPEVFLSVDSEAVGAEQYELIRISQLFDGTINLSECLNALHGDLEAVQIVVGLYKAGLLKIVEFGVI